MNDKSKKEDTILRTMDELIAQFPKQIADAIQLAKEAKLSFYKGKTFHNVVICGMGGSGIGGKMVAQLFADQLCIPVIPVSDYALPNFVNENSLVIGSSYSGNTEETLSTINAAEKKGATIVGISSGGELIRFCQAKKYDFIRVPGGNPPRSMLAFSLVQLINILAVSGVIQEDALELLTDCRHLLNEELISIKKMAKEAADLLFERQGIFYASSVQETVAIRARQQINENSKKLCWHHVIPEMNHNELVGWGGGNEQYAVVFFVSQFLSDQNKLRVDFCEEVIEEKTDRVMMINGKGNSVIEEVFYFIHIIDWTSLYLANLMHVDPVEVRVIDRLKKTLNNG